MTKEWPSEVAHALIEEVYGVQTIWNMKCDTYKQVHKKEAAWKVIMQNLSEKHQEGHPKFFENLNVGECMKLLHICFCAFTFFPYIIAPFKLLTHKIPKLLIDGCVISCFS